MKEEKQIKEKMQSYKSYLKGRDQKQIKKE
jgi:hypothetical protein